MALMTGTVAAGAPGVIETWDLEGLLEGGREASFQEYLKWVENYKQGPESNDQLEGQTVPSGHFYQIRFREDGYREYDFKE